MKEQFSIKLFCIPHAGGSALAYHRWKSSLSKGIQLIPLELAGRGKRIELQLYENFEQAIHDIYCLLLDSIDENPYVLLGHSMGGLLAYEIVQKLIAKNKKLPIHLVVSGCLAPQKQMMVDSLSDKPLDILKEYILSLGGTPIEIFEDPTLRRIMLPIIRSDYQMMENYEFFTGFYLLPCDISIFTGKSDPITLGKGLGWDEICSGSVNYYQFSGGHFFIYDPANHITSRMDFKLTKEQEQYRMEIQNFARTNLNNIV